MIEDFTIHASNERTFLSWVRTAISIVGFGLIVTNIANSKLDTPVLTLSGLWLLAFGAAMIIAAGIRFLLLRRLIRSKKVVGATPIFLDIILAVALVLMIAALAGFGFHVSHFK